MIFLDGVSIRQNLDVFNIGMSIVYEFFCTIFVGAEHLFLVDLGHIFQQ